MIAPTEFLDTAEGQCFLTLLNTYPSPHNGQPFSLVPRGTHHYSICFDRARGLQATNISLLFSFVSVGVFFAYLEECATALGHSAQLTEHFPEIQDLAGTGLIEIGFLELTPGTGEPEQERQVTLRRRGTSRRKYSAGLTGTEAQELTQLAATDRMSLHFLPGFKGAEAIWLNQKAIFDDMFNPEVRAELEHWLRFSETEKVAKKDGLSYDCMELNPKLLRFIFNHHTLLRKPVIAPLLRAYYLRTMRDSSSIGYLLAPFTTAEEAVRIGRMIARLWLQITEYGKYLHPFGSIVANEANHADFARLAGLTAESRESNYVVFIFRAGASTHPPEALRLPVDSHLYQRNESE